MTIQNRPPSLQPSAAPAFSGAILVSTAELAAVHEDVRRVSRRLNVIEDLSALGWEETDGICRAISRAARQLGEMLDGRKGGSLQ